MESYKRNSPIILRNKIKKITVSVIVIVLINIFFQSCSEEKMEHKHGNYYVKTNSNHLNNRYYQSLYIKDNSGKYIMVAKSVLTEIYFNNEKALLVSNEIIQGNSYRRLILCNSNTLVGKDITDDLALKYTGNSKFGAIKVIFKIDKTSENKFLVSYMGESINDDPVVEFTLE